MKFFDEDAYRNWLYMLINQYQYEFAGSLEGVGSVGGYYTVDNVPDWDDGVMLATSPGFPPWVRFRRQWSGIILGKSPSELSPHGGLIGSLRQLIVHHDGCEAVITISISDMEATIGRPLVLHWRSTGSPLPIMPGHTIYYDESLCPPTTSP